MDRTSNLRYMIIGAGGTGGAAGSHLAHAGHDVTFIARGRHLEAMKRDGLRVIKPAGNFTVYPVQAYTAEEYAGMLDSNMAERPDVIIVCVKGYSVDDIIPFIGKAAGPDSVVIPILNIFGTGGRMQEKLPGITVTDGCIYVASEISEPGVILMNGNILRIIFGLRRGQTSELTDVLERIRDDMNDSGIRGILSDNIERDALRKFSYVSPHGACGLYYGVTAGDIQKPGEVRDSFAELVREVSDLADAMGFGFGNDAVSANLKIMDGLAADMTTSLQRDIARGGSSEIDGLIYEVLRLAEKYNVSIPEYEKIAAELKRRGLEQ